MQVGDRLSQPPADGGRSAAGRSARAQLASLLRGLDGARGRRRLLLLAAGIVLVICATAAAQVRLNLWSGAFYDAIGQRDAAAFLRQALVFAVIVGVLLGLGVAQTWLHELLKARLRERLTDDLVAQWLKPKRAFRLGFAGEIGANPDQRVQEDARHFTELCVDLGVGLVQASLLLASFVGVLWVLSAQILFTFGDRSFAIPGYMVWCALAYALAGSWISWRIGRPLVALNAERYACEAELRFALVRVSESAEGIALYGGEADERRRIDAALARVVAVMLRLAGALARLTWITAGYGWFAIIVPIVAAAPGYFGGALSLGDLMMVVGAFNQVQAALRWFIDNVSRIADWRATLLRVAAFRDALLELEGAGEGRITLADHPAGGLAFADFSVLLPDGRAAIEGGRVEIGPGERVLIVGAPGSGKSTLFRAMAGLWPWGTGAVHLPPRAEVMFVPQRPHLPLGTLRAALTYPDDPAGCDDGAVRAALERVGLGHLAAALDRTERWDKELSLEEQQRLAFARLLIRAPRWVFLDEAVDALDEEHRRLILSIFERELAGATVVSIGSRPARNGFYTRTLRIVRLPDGAAARPHFRPRPGRPPVPAPG